MLFPIIHPIEEGLPSVVVLIVHFFNIISNIIEEGFIRSCIRFGHTTK